MIQFIFIILLIVLIILLMVQSYDIDGYEKFNEIESSTEPLKPISQILDDITNELKDIRQVSLYK